VSLDAVLSSLSSGQGESEATVGVNLLDISDFSGQILERSATGQIFITDAAYGDYSGLQIGDLRSIVRDTATSISGPGYEEFVNNDGTEFAIDRSITGNFNVAANKDYLLLFSIGAIYTGEGVGKSDALNTGVFSFSAGQSLDLTSASGSTYSAVAPVPLPAGFSLLVAGLIGLGALARRKKHA
jgi:hypothetical protein